ncbi:hypothetical protein CBR_g25991 [Chara braunii]|uniref:Uncharacterized protein n=1 Tax=Chara braunii TaxID=69332 RepID=A0A388L6Z4_CHABU|nr:hypothetical protein CBR_g25991 [Chara braunii]|eukprot:GBG78054.1 hypothetical protein CBR_g25991 [Chara braunii]
MKTSRGVRGGSKGRSAITTGTVSSWGQPTCSGGVVQQRRPPEQNVVQDARGEDDFSQMGEGDEEEYVLEEGEFEEGGGVGEFKEGEGKEGEGEEEEEEGGGEEEEEDEEEEEEEEEEDKDGGEED